MEADLSGNKIAKNQQTTLRPDERPHSAENLHVEKSQTTASEKEVCQTPDEAGKYEGPVTTFFVTEQGSGQNRRDRKDIETAVRIARSKGPQPVGRKEIINGVTVRWLERTYTGTVVEYNGPHLGGDPGPVKEFKFNKVAAPAGHAPPVRPLAPQVPPPREEPI